MGKSKPKPKPAPAIHIIEVTYSDGTVMQFTPSQWGETIARALLERCVDCPRFALPKK